MFWRARETLVKHPPGGCCNVKYPSETHLKIRSRQIYFTDNTQLSCRIFCNSFSHNTTITAMCSAKFKTIRQPRNNSWTKEIMRYFEDELRTGVLYHNNPMKVSCLKVPVYHLHIIYSTILYHKQLICAGFGRDRRPIIKYKIIIHFARQVYLPCDQT